MVSRAGAAQARSFATAPSSSWWRALLLGASLLVWCGCSGASSCPEGETAPEIVAQVKPDARWSPALEDIVGFDEGEAWLTPYFIYGTNLALPGAVLLWLAGTFLYHLRKARKWRRARQATAATELAPGPTILEGTVRRLDDAADGDGPVVVLRVEQAGQSFYRSSSKRGPNWKTRWTEVERKLVMQPFVLDTASGPVRLDPDPQAFLIDDLEPLPRDGAVRTLRAEVHAGDKLSVTGELVQAADQRSGGYRGGARGWVLRPPAGGRLLLSTQGLAASHADHGATAAVGFVLLGIVVLLAQLLAIPYHLARAAAVDEAAVVVSRCSYQEDKENYRFVDYQLLKDGQRTETRVNADTYARLPLGTVVPANVLRLTDEPRITLGAGATTNAGISLIPMAVLVFGSFLTVWLVARSRPWWERKRLDEVVDGELEKQP